jgi:hypothetical protein
MNRPPEILKSAANRFAQRVGTRQDSDILSLLARFDSSVYQAPSPDGRSGAAPLRVGIWEKKVRDSETVFTRSTDGEAWSLWSQTGTIRMRPKTRRVVVLGESVARGYFYDPHFNPASALESMLRACTGGDDIDVIDLARIDCKRNQLIELAKSSVHLSPSALVIFAGNNWHPAYSFGRAEMDEVADVLRERKDWRPLKDLFEEKLRRQVCECLQIISGIARAKGIPAVFVIPEFNLKDWRDPGNAPFFFDSAQNNEWTAARGQLRKATADHDAEGAMDAARKMAPLDYGTSPLPCYVFADHALRKHDHESARKFLEQARDASCSLVPADSPRCYSLAQQIIRTHAGRFGITVVDLPAVFKEYLHGELPDHRIFHDYCHLTVDGIRVAMAATAQALQPLLGVAPLTPEKLRASVPDLPHSINAEAFFLSAVHNANWGQSLDIVERHFLAALQHSESVSEPMRLYLDFHVRRQPTALCSSFDRLIAGQSLSSANVFFAPPRSRKVLNFTLIQGIINALGNLSNAEIPKIDGLLKAEHGVGAGTVNLLERRYCTSSFAFVEGEWEERSAFYRAIDNHSRFTLVAEHPMSLKLKLTYRNRGGCSKPIILRLNGVPVSAAPASAAWSAHEFTAPEEFVRAGVNTLYVEWPAVEWSKQERLEKASEAFERGIDENGQQDFCGILNGVYPAFGEIYSFHATCAKVKQ